MDFIESVNTYVTGVFPDTVADNSSGVSTPDGFEFIAEWINNSVIGNQQDWLDYASITPNGVTESAGLSQVREAIQLGNGIGPGIYKQYAKEDDPSVTGDRILLLSEQGVLVASYPDLDAACYVGDAGTDNADRAAAGGKFYRSSDAGGVTPNIAGPYLQLPANNPTFRKQYLGAVDFNVTATAGWINVRAVLTPYKINGELRLKGNITGTLTSNYANTIVSVSGVVFKNVPLYKQHVGVSQSGSASIPMIYSYTGINTGQININWSGLFTANAQLSITIDVELESWPTWADDFEFPWGITY